MQQKTLIAVLCVLGAGMGALSNLQEKGELEGAAAASQKAVSARVAPGFSLGFRKDLVAGLAGDVHLNFSCVVQLMEEAGSVPVGTHVRVASYDVALGKVTPEGMTTKMHSRGMWHLDLDGKEPIVRTYSTSNFASLVNTVDLPPMVRFTCRPIGDKLWRDAVSKADIETSLEFAED